MSIGVKRVNRNAQLTLWERMYLPEIFRGLYITSTHFFRNFISVFAEFFTGDRRKRTIMTVYYPEEKVVVPPAYRGRPMLVVDEAGHEKCVACGLCERVCPPECISIIGAERENGERYPESYILDGGKCIYCGFCEEVCPKEAIVVTHNYENLASYTRTGLIYKKQDLLVSESRIDGRLRYIREAYSQCKY